VLSHLVSCECPRHETRKECILVVDQYYELERTRQNLEFFLEETQKNDQLPSTKSIAMYYIIVIADHKCSVPLTHDDLRFDIVPGAQRQL